MLKRKERKRERVIVRRGRGDSREGNEEKVKERNMIGYGECGMREEGRNVTE